MVSCLCCRLYDVSTPTTIREYAFSGSLCRIHEFQTLDGLRYCVTIFSLSNYKQLHFPHDEYKILMCKLHVLLSTQSIAIFNRSTWQKSNDSRLSIEQEQLPYNEDFKISFGNLSMTIGPVTAFGLLKTTPFVDDKNVVCDPKWDICACKSCPVFKRLSDFEAAAKEHSVNCRIENMIFLE